MHGRSLHTGLLLSRHSTLGYHLAPYVDQDHCSTILICMRKWTSSNPRSVEYSAIEFLHVLSLCPGHSTPLLAALVPSPRHNRSFLSRKALVINMNRGMPLEQTSKPRDKTIAVNEGKAKQSKASTETTIVQKRSSRTCDRHISTPIQHAIPTFSSSSSHPSHQHNKLYRNKPRLPSKCNSSSSPSPPWPQPAPSLPCSRSAHPSPSAQHSTHLSAVNWTSMELST